MDEAQGEINKQMTDGLNTTKPSTHDLKDDGIAFWSRHCVPVLSSLLQSIGSYTPEQQKSHLRFMEDHVIPNMGPPPDHTHPKSLLTPNGSPFETSINFSDNGKPCLRFTFEPVMPQGNNLSDGPLPAIAENVQADMRWFNDFASEFFLSHEERVAIKEKMPPDTARIPRCFLAFDLAGGDRVMKAYFSPMMKHMVSGINSDEASINLMKRLNPHGQSLIPALDFIEEYQRICQDPPLIQVIAIDCIDPDAGARVKIYINPRSNTFDAVRDHVTFGGRRSDETTMKGLEVLREIWHLLFNEAEYNADDLFSKPVFEPTSGHQGLCCSWELRSGQEVPDVKVYVPLFQYFSTDQAIAESLEKVFKTRGWSWGIDGTYKKMFEQAFKRDNLSNGVETPLVHTYISFNFSEKKGAYITLYLAPPPQLA